MQTLNNAMAAINAVIWHNWVLYVVLGTGVLFTLWSGFCQFRALTHGTRVIRGDYEDPSDPGAISHFQALSAALSATVGLGNIAGVAVAIGLGGPGAIFYMWLVGLVGMALKTTEVSLSMIYRDTSNPDNPHGGPMFVASRGLRELGMAPLGKAVGGIFVLTLLVSAVTGGNMFQAWNVAVVTEDAIGLPQVAVGAILAVLVGLVIIGGVKRIGAVAGRLVPVMVAVYLAAALWVLAVNIEQIPALLALILRHAFSPTEASGAFVGGSVGLAFSWGMQRALFSSEAGQGSSPIAHAAARTDEPTREAVVAGLEPFIDTIVVCTLTALVILSSGAWNREHEAPLPMELSWTEVGPGESPAPLWTLRGGGSEAAEGFEGSTHLPTKAPAARRVSGAWASGDGIFVVARVTDSGGGSSLVRLQGVARPADEGAMTADWGAIASATRPTIDSEHQGIYGDYVGGALTTYAFDRVTPGLGTWLVLIASWLFALSTQISWSYYGEQGIVFLFGERAVMPYKIVYCTLIIVATLGFIRTTTELNNFTNVGTGVMLWANIPIMLLFGARAMREYHGYFRRMKGGEETPRRHVGDGATVPSPADRSSR